MVQGLLTNYICRAVLAMLENYLYSFVEKRIHYYEQKE